MIAFGRIERTLEFLEREYQKHSTSYDSERPVLFSKIAVIEYCGWLEETFDEISRNCVRRKLRTLESRKDLEKKIKDTHGFTYIPHFRSLLTFGLGLTKVLEIERALDRDGSLSRLQSNLGSLNSMRKEAAHTHTSGRTSRFQSPSLIIDNYKNTKPTIQKLWTVVAE